MTWVDHEDYPCSIEEHHAHGACGSSKLRLLFTDEQPGPKSAGIGHAVEWLARTPESQWGDSPRVVKRPDLRGYPGGIAGWEDDNPGVIGLPHAEWAKATMMATALRSHPRVATILASEHVEVEQTVLATHRETGVQCKARPDFRLPGAWLGDLKTTKCTDPMGFAYSAGSYGYDLQAALYASIEADRHGLDRLKYGYDLIVVSNVPPHAVGVFALPPEWMELGRRQLDAALRLWALFQRTKVRPPSLMACPGQWLPPPSYTHKRYVREVEKHVERCEELARD